MARGVRAPSAESQAKTPAEKFRLGAIDRMTKVFKSVSTIEDMAVQDIYEWTPEQVAKMKAKLNAHIDFVFGKFDHPAAASTFTWDDDEDENGDDEPSDGNVEEMKPRAGAGKKK